MPALPNQPNVLKIQAHFNVGTTLNIRSKYYWTYTGGPPTASDLSAMASHFGTYAATNFPQLMPTSSFFVGIDITDLTTPSSATGSYSTSAAGIEAGAPLPASNAMLENFTINRRYRGGKPRVYWPFGTASNVQTAQTWTTAFMTLVQTQLTGYKNNIRGYVQGGTTMANQVSISYYQSFTPVVDPVTGRTRDVPKVRATAIAPDLVTGSSLNPKIASQRRRIAA